MRIAATIRWYLFSILMSCSSASPAHPSLEELQEAAAMSLLAERLAPYRQYLVWTFDGTQQANSYWISGNTVSGTIIASQPFVFFPMDETIYKLESTEIELSLCDCQSWMQQEMKGDCPVAQDSGRGVVPRLVDMISDQKIAVLSPEDLVKEKRPIHSDYTNNVSLVGSVGPYLFFLSSEEKKPCGAANATMSTGYYVFDLQKQELIDVLTDMERQRISEEEQIAAFEQLRSDPNLFLASPDDLTLTLIEPFFSPNKGLTLSYHFSRETSFADSDGNWSAYSRSTTVEAKHLPEALAPYAGLPEVVQNFAILASHVRIAGWFPIEKPDKLLNHLPEIFDLGKPTDVVN